MFEVVSVVIVDFRGDGACAVVADFMVEATDVGMSLLVSLFLSS